MNSYFTQLELISDETYYSDRLNSTKVLLKIMHGFDLIMDGDKEVAITS